MLVPTPVRSADLVRSRAISPDLADADGLVATLRGAAVEVDTRAAYGVGVVAESGGADESARSLPSESRIGLPDS